MSSTAMLVDQLRTEYGDRQPMGAGAARPESAHYTLTRRFKGQLDLLVIFNTLRCHYNCSFCNLPTKSSSIPVPYDLLIAQFESALMRHANVLHVLERMTISNEGSVLDTQTFGEAALTTILQAADRMPALTRIVLETRPEFISQAYIKLLRSCNTNAWLDFLVGFETLDDRIRNVVLGKRQSRSSLAEAMDAIASVERARLTSYILLKCDTAFSDEQGVEEAKATIRYLVAEANSRRIPLSVRINPMYIATDVRWSTKAIKGGYRPPRLTDALEVARFAEMLGADAFIGLSTEGLADEANSFRSREDFSRQLLKDAIVFNQASRV